jgi:hypothetical protein
MRPPICVVSEDAHDLLTLMFNNIKDVAALGPDHEKRIKMLCDNYAKRVEGFTVVTAAECYVAPFIKPSGDGDPE